MRARVISVATIAAGLVLVGGATSAIGASAPRRAHATKSPLPIMQIAPAPVNGQDYSLGTLAAVKEINASGGIDGHKITYSFCSVGAGAIGDPNTVAACGRTAVQDHDLASVGSFTVYDNELLPTLQKAKIADLTAPSGSNDDSTSPDAFPVISSGYPILVGQAEVLVKQANCKKIGVVTLSGIPETTTIENTVAAGAKAAGAQVGAPVTVTETTVDFDAAIAQLHGEGVDCVVDGFPTAAQTQPLLQAIKSSGTNMKMSVNVEVLTNSALKSIGSLINGVYGSDSAYINALTSTSDTANADAAEKTMIKAIKKYEPAGAAENHAVFPGYASVEVFAAAAKKVAAAGKALTAANIYKALSSGPISTGLTPTLDYAKPSGIKGQPRMEPVYVNFFKVENNKMVALTHGSYSTVAALNKYPNG